jgi:excisionase family DNA binding protein
MSERPQDIVGRHWALHPRGVRELRRQGDDDMTSRDTGRAATIRTVRHALPAVKRFYTVHEVAELLGVSAPTIYREIRAGRFPAIRVRGRYVIPAKALDELEQAALDHARTELDDLG